MRVPSRQKYLPLASVAEPKILLANSRLTTATGGAFLSSCHDKVLPASKLVRAASKYSGDIFAQHAENEAHVLHQILDQLQVSLGSRVLFHRFQSAKFQHGLASCLDWG
jgi:hypothetical protein